MNLDKETPAKPAAGAAEEEEEKKVDAAIDKS